VLLQTQFMLSIPKIVFCTQFVALNNVGTVKVPTSSPLLLTQAFQCLYLCHHKCLCATAGYFRYGWQSYILLYTLHSGSVTIPVSQCLIASHSLPFHPLYTVTSICELSYCYRSVCGGSFMFSVSLLYSPFFLPYLYNFFCCNNNNNNKNNNNKAFKIH
jgi:hypothetical protein